MGGMSQCPRIAHLTFFMMGFLQASHSSEVTGFFFDPALTLVTQLPLKSSPDIPQWGQHLGFLMLWVYIFMEKPMAIKAEIKEKIPKAFAKPISVLASIFILIFDSFESLTK